MPFWKEVVVAYFNLIFIYLLLSGTKPRFFSHAALSLRTILTELPNRNAAIHFNCCCS